MDTLALVPALLFIGTIIDLKDTPSDNLGLVMVALSFLGALAIGIYVAVAA